MEIFEKLWGAALINIPNGEPVNAIYCLPPVIAACNGEIPFAVVSLGLLLLSSYTSVPQYQALVASILVSVPTNPGFHLSICAI